MSIKSGFVRCLFLSLMVLFVGCAELESLREEKIAMTQRMEVLQKENKNFDNRLALSEQEKVELVEERGRLADEGRNMEERLNGLREENSLMTQRIEKIHGENVHLQIKFLNFKKVIHEVVESQRPRVELLGEIAK